MNAAGTLAVSRRGGWGLGSDHLAWLPSNGANPFYSSDGGATWNASTGFTSKGYWIFALKQRELKADPFVADKFYLGATWGGGFFVSLDGGKSWQEQKGANLPQNSHHGQLETNRAVQNDLWFCDGWEGATSHGLWHSVDGGATFTKIPDIDHAITLAVGKGFGRSWR